MIIFFNDIALQIVNAKQDNESDHYQVHIDANKENIEPGKLIHNVLVTGADKPDKKCC